MCRKPQYAGPQGNKSINEKEKKNHLFQQYRVLNQNVSEKYLLKVKKSIGQLRDNKIHIKNNSNANLSSTKKELTVDLQFCTFHRGEMKNPGHHSTKSTDFLATYGPKTTCGGSNAVKVKFEEPKHRAKLKKKLTATASRLVNSDLRIAKMTPKHNLSTNVQLFNKSKSVQQKEDIFISKTNNEEWEGRGDMGAESLGADQDLMRMLESYETHIIPDKLPDGYSDQVRSMSSLTEIDIVDSSHQGLNSNTNTSGHRSSSSTAFQYPLSSNHPIMHPHHPALSPVPKLGKPGGRHILVQSVIPRSTPLTNQNSFEAMEYPSPYKDPKSDPMGNKNINKYSNTSKLKRPSGHFKTKSGVGIGSQSERLTHKQKFTDSSPNSNKFEIKKYEIIGKCVENLSSSEITKSAVLNSFKEAYWELYEIASARPKVSSPDLNSLSKQNIQLKTEMDVVNMKNKKLEKNNNDLEMQKMNYFKDIKHKLEVISKLKCKLQNSEREKEDMGKDCSRKENEIIGLRREKEKIEGKLREAVRMGEGTKALRKEGNGAKAELEYYKQRENKLMYLLAIIQQRGHPVKDIYESEVRDLNTSRFIDGNFVEIPKDHPTASQLNSSSFDSFDSQASYTAIPLNIRCPKQHKPKIIPSLKVQVAQDLPESSSGEDDYETSVRDTEKLKSQIVKFYSDQKLSEKNSRFKKIINKKGSRKNLKITELQKKKENNVNNVVRVEKEREEGCEEIEKINDVVEYREKENNSNIGVESKNMLTTEEYLMEEISVPSTGLITEI